jgi:membrane protease YdiL (CAAX protease family)
MSNKDSSQQRLVLSRGILAFLLIAFGLAWLPFLPTLVDPAASGVAPILMPVAPAIACFVVRKWVTREGFGDAGLRPGLRHWRLYLLAVAWPIGANLLGVVLALLFHGAPSGFTFPWGRAAPSPLSLITWSLVSIALAPLIFGEEFGWRGYLQVRLLPGTPVWAALATGLIWGVWHYPLILIGGEQTDSRLVTLVLFPVWTTVFSIFLGWLRLRTGSIWPGSVAHAANNVTADSLNRLTFTGRTSGVPSDSSNVISLAAEAALLLSIVAADRLRRPRESPAVHVVEAPGLSKMASTSE